MGRASESRPIEILLVEDNPGDVRLTREGLRETSLRNRLHVVRFDDGAPFKTFDLPGKADKCSWSPDSRALVYIYTAGGVSNLWRLPLDGSRAAQITDFKSDSIRTFSYSRDGRQLACYMLAGAN